MLETSVGTVQSQRQQDELSKEPQAVSELCKIF